MPRNFLSKTPYCTEDILLKKTLLYGRYFFSITLTVRSIVCSRTSYSTEDIWLKTPFCTKDIYKTKHTFWKIFCSKSLTIRQIFDSNPPTKRRKFGLKTLFCIYSYGGILGSTPLTVRGYFTQKALLYGEHLAQEPRYLTENILLKKPVTLRRTFYS